VIAAGGEEIVEIDRLMSAMEIADADVKDSGAEFRTVVAPARRRPWAVGPTRRRKV